MGFSPKATPRKDIRSITLPCRSHPSNNRIEQALNKVNAWMETSSFSNPSAKTICSGVSQLMKLYECLNDLVKTSLSQTSTISNKQNMKWTDELLDESVSFLDILSSTADVLLQTKQQVRDLGCDIRRKGGRSIESIISSYIVFRKKLRKDVKKSVASLKKMDNMIYDCPFMKDIENHHLTWVIQVFRQVSASTTVILRLLLNFFVTPIYKTRPTSRFTALSRYISKGKVVPEEKAVTNTNELQRLDATLFGYGTRYKLEFILIAPKKLEEFEATIDDVNSHLESMSRRLVSTRSSLLNLVSFN
ncbi:hypothetical protein L1887_35713 [Cichorium endivia]|nr:hypothetical protein L1887_35713 [Cichorium endivia]